MSTIINGTSSAITFPDSSVQNTSAIVSGYVPYANLPAGSVLQVVTATNTTTDTTSSGTFVATSLAGSITPKFSTSKILIIVSGTFDNNASGGAGSWSIYRGATQLGSASYGSGLFWGQSTRMQGPVAFNYLDSPATTSSTTYTIYQRVTGGSSINFGAGNTNVITLLEIAA